MTIGLRLFYLSEKKGFSRMAEPRLFDSRPPGWINFDTPGERD